MPLRPLSPVERVWLVADALGAPFVITIVVEGTGEIDGIERAVALAAEENPGARARLEGVLGGTRWVDSGEAPPVVPMALPSPGPVVGRRLLADSPGLEVGVAPDGVVFRVHHALMDGRGLWHFVEEVFRALRGEPLVGGDDGFSDTAAAGLGRASVPVEDDVAATGEHTGNASPIWGHRRIEGTWSGLLGHVALAVADVARSHTPGGQIGFQIPVDLRRLGGPSGTANRTGLVRLDCTADATVQGLLDQLAERVDNGDAQAWVRSAEPADGLPLWLMRWGGRLKANKAIRSSRFGGTAVLSNLGRVDLRQLDAPGFQASRTWWIPPCGPSTAAFLGLMGDGRALELTAVLPAGLASEGRLDRLLDAIVQRLT
ncbi:MAG: hypothetical protein GY884_00465 [Proteobacteria bacterium]|nr:hypothetical protein [Pseudomonadota bacterium]